MSANILIVDDSRVTQHMLRHVLQKNGHFVIVAENGVEALPLLEAGPIDLMISDINMPQMDGFELINHVRQDPTYDQLPIITLTATGDDMNQNRATELGSNGFLTMPFDSNRLIDLVETLLDGS